MKWEDLLPEVMPHVPGCPEMLAEDMIRAAAVRFCRDTHGWSEQLDAVYPYAGEVHYRLYPPDDAEIIVVESIKQGEKGKDLAASLNIFGALTFDTAPDVDAGEITVRAILQPGRQSTGMPDRMGSHYEQALIDGALSRLLMMPKKDWTSPQLAEYHRGLFNNAAVEVRVRRARGNTEQAIRVTPHPF